MGLGSRGCIRVENTRVYLAVYLHVQAVVCMIAHQARYLNKYSNNYLIVIFDLLIGALHLTAFTRIRNLAEIVWDRQTILQEFVSAKCPQAQSV